MKVLKINQFFRKMGELQIRYRWGLLVFLVLITAFGIAGLRHAVNFGSYMLSPVNGMFRIGLLASMGLISALIADFIMTHRYPAHKTLRQGVHAGRCGGIHFG